MFVSFRLHPPCSCLVSLLVLVCGQRLTYLMNVFYVLVGVSERMNATHWRYENPFNPTWLMNNRAVGDSLHHPTPTALSVKAV